MPDQQKKEQVTLEELVNEINSRINNLCDEIESPHAKVKLSVGQFIELDLHLKARTKSTLITLTKTTAVITILAELLKIATR